ncbi:MAG: glucose-1-phosphate thymidylyltransferase [Chloroflexi bacterium]|nr:glucose-1-phosphate thymidylyltransferase [Chloroflexota bacterium]
MKALILSGGKGSRLRPLTYTGAKQLVPVANKPVLFYAIEDAVEAGITDIGIVVGDTGEYVKAAVQDGSRFGARVTYIHQPEPLGIAHAVKISRPFIGDEPFVLLLGDNFVRDGIAKYVKVFRDEPVDCQVLLYPVSNPQDFGIAEVRDGRVVRVVEKPKEPFSNLAVVGIYFFDHHVFEATDAIHPSWRGELEITDTIQYLVANGFKVRALPLDSPWIDTGKKDDILEANRLILDLLEPCVQGKLDSESQVHGRVSVAATARVLRSVVRGPAIIGAEAVIEDAFVGPYTSIGARCRIQQSEIENSVLMEESSITGVARRITDSLIGRHVTVTGNSSRPQAHRLTLGDHSYVVLSGPGA